ncbi:hypothetical protein ACJX0J_028834 [Zea mays]
MQLTTNKTLHIFSSSLVLFSLLQGGIKPIYLERKIKSSPEILRMFFFIYRIVFFNTITIKYYGRLSATAAFFMFFLPAIAQLDSFNKLGAHFSFFFCIWSLAFCVNIQP